MTDQEGKQPGTGHPTGTPSETPTPPEIAGVVGGITRRVPGPGGRPSDSMLAVYKDRLTYTFIFQDEVASIHFDRRRREIFFKGHNLRYMDLTDQHHQALWGLVEVLTKDREGQALAAVYRETLAHLLTDNPKR